VNESLLHLYELQKIDSQLDELIESRGELPERVEEMRRTLDTQRTEVETLRKEIADMEKRSREMTDESTELRDKVEKYKAQQFDVKTTREYDAITFQLEDSSKRLNQNLEAVGRMGIQVEQLKVEEQALTTDVENLERDLKESEAALKEILAETQNEEKDLAKKREGLIKQIEAVHLSMYNRVRPAKGGLAVVPIKNGVCGGCFNAIPRQLVLELKRGDRHTVCEYCGRIVVGEPISLAVDGEPVPVTYATDDDESESGDE